MLFRLVSQIIDRVKLESFDRQLGAMLGLAKGVLLCVAITFFAVGLLPQDQGQAIVETKSGRYIVALLNKTESVVPPELHQVLDPYLNSIEQRLGGNGPSPSGQDLQRLWQGAAEQPAGWPQQPQMPWEPPSGPARWPAEPPQSATDPYRTTGSTNVGPANGAVPREPNPFPGPYSGQTQGVEWR
jgi:membrane protein required for colicin V production